MASVLTDSRGFATTGSQTQTLEPRKSRKRSSSLLGAEIPGDTSAPAISTSRSPAARQASKSRRRKLSKQRQDGQMIPGPENFFLWYKEMSYRHTWVNPLIAMLVIIGCYLPNPTRSNWAHDFIFVAYPLEEKGPNGEQLYSKGLGDGKFLFFYTLFFTFTREFIMQRILYPLSQKLLPKSTRRNKATIARFLEQAYTAIYFAVFGPLGLYVMSQTPGLWFFNTTPYWSTHPNIIHTGIFKAYYLLQWSYWLQQAIVLVLMLEKPRKDFKELVIHHIVTVALITLSWRFHFTYIGLSVFITHDVSDFFLATSKVFNYIDSPITGPYFVVFIFSWVYLRHYHNLWILWSVFYELPYVGEYYLDWDEPHYKCGLAKLVISTLLSALQLVNIFWLYCVLRVAYRYVFKAELADVRSEDEGGEEDDDVGFDDDDTKTPTLEETPKIQLNGEALASPIDGQATGFGNHKPNGIHKRA
ncbi:hypothetical protein TWF106_001632 [Orbilia oligospora]|uniref:TLC domain-containing protein n=2 Tax=Orbilia oligospora TaxID=2813651 RepID=A0A6G1M0D1_ORBOL|nr:hypothetical protein TWF788_007862 [Orbilia oligospora]KAF3204116.1 hypothetical protein TWF106_001632 [Orbilia oligospora]KAF3221267.1 hypothetical protein TWF679_007962 [Orbilia oligospora]KAF3241021.1 hypothetical protein TWF192_009276 [Orbilia oligospora]